MLGRRDLLAGGAATMAMAVIGTGLLRDGDSALLLPAGTIPADRDSLILHDGRPAGMALVRAARSKAAARHISDRIVTVLASQGFARTGALLDQARGRAVIALLDDADSLVVETLLQARGAHGLTRQRHGRQTLLVARI